MRIALGMLLSFVCAAGLLLFAGLSTLMAKVEDGEVYPPQRFSPGRLIALGAAAAAILILGYGLYLAWTIWSGG
ncbi:MAG: hypothetical protein RBT75_16710 [Anaerolineae bacterium]|jgi:hypothetical protein|nr:hypothetical protein [Anaerolineae bacterium]